MWKLNIFNLYKVGVRNSRSILLCRKVTSCYLTRHDLNNVKQTTYSQLRLPIREMHNRPSVENELSYNSNSYTYRTHTCGELRSDHAGLKVTLCGWVQYQRLSKFILLRDAYGIIQCIVKENKSFPDIALETVIKIKGTVVLRPKTMVNATMPTGEIEVQIDELEILNTVDKLPFNLRDYQKAKEQLRLQHRYIDLRFPEMQKNLRTRSQMLHNMRRFLIETHDFVEVETPTLFCRTPGGAREFVVPTHHSGMFYSLVQSPQQFKQMLMVGGVDRYFQIARCYRDETSRPDRQPEFTQLDVELSFTNLDHIITLIEELLYETFVLNLPKPPFKRLTYKYALENYGTDKPNLSYGLKFINVTKLFKERAKDHDFGAYALPYSNKLGKFTKKYREDIKALSKKYNVQVVLDENVGKMFTGDFLAGTVDKNVNSVLICLGNNENACLCLGEIRGLLAHLLKSQNLLVIDNIMHPVWIVDFPLFMEGENGLETCHHPFTAPHSEDIELLESNPLKVKSLAYDLVLNGNEVGGGSVRIHNMELQKKILEILKIEPDSLSHFLNALKSGCPPHAGIALGIDRLVTIACNAETIRDVIAFPKSHDGKDPLSGAPNKISEEDYKYYHITTVT